MESMAASLWPFVDDRTNMVTAALQGTPAGRERQVREVEVDRTRKILIDRLGGEKNAVFLVDAFEMALSGVVAIDRDFVYAAGLQDGFQLAKIFDGNVIPWLADAYVPGNGKEDGGDA